MKILAVFRFLPSRLGAGAPQRYHFYLRSLAALGEVHLVVVQPSGHVFRFKPGELEEIVDCTQSAIFANADEWRIGIPASIPSLPFVNRYLLNTLVHGSPETQALATSTVVEVRRQLGEGDFDLVYASRLISALALSDLRDSGQLRAPVYVCDFDDVMSDVKEEELGVPDLVRGRQTRLAQRLEGRIIRRAEDRIARTWSAVTVSSERDVDRLARRYGPQAKSFRVPNVVDKTDLPYNLQRDGKLRLLFVGNLSYGPNVHGLRWYLSEVHWRLDPAVRPELTVVGMNPEDAVVESCAAPGIRLVANAPSIEEFYQAADLVIAPIHYGGGTRIKVLEAMAYGRPILATSKAVEGLNLTPGVDYLNADTAEAFGDAVRSIYTSRDALKTIAAAGKRTQVRRFSPDAMTMALGDMIKTLQ